MQIYLVGGAVRDKLLNLQVIDNDYVVVGATPEQMLNAGYTRVGKDFPVFLHPKTKEEYALARTERKSGRGYTGFECDTSPNITLEQDLRRRDLTVNAMAMDQNGTIIDPYDGSKDLTDRRLKHVSEAFVEDPLRVFRVARFAARFSSLDFFVDNDTLAMMKKIASSGELKSLSPTRVWQETAKALLEPNPEVFFTTLKSVEALKDWFMELDALWGIPNPASWHPEIDTGVHTMMVLQKAVAYSNKIEVRFAALVHDLGKALTDTTNWPSHHGHDELGVQAITQMCERLGVPNECRDLALLTSQHHSLVHRLYEKSPEQILSMLDACDAWRKPDRFKNLLLVCKADFMGRKNFSDRRYTQHDHLWAMYEICNKVSAQGFIQKGLQGRQIKDAMNAERLTIIRDISKRPHEDLERTN